MSIKWMAWVGDNSPYRSTQLLIHLWLADYANDNGICWPAQKTIAKKARCSSRYVRVTMKDMEERGLLQITPRPGTSNIYKLLKGPDMAADPGTEGSALDGTMIQEGRNRVSAKPPLTTNEPPTSPDTGVSGLRPKNIVCQEIGTVELEYVPVEEEESYGRKRPKYQTPTAEMMKYMAPFGRKWFKNRQERGACKLLINLLTTEMITQEWVENVLSWATKPRGDGRSGPRWSFDGFLNVVTDTERYRDWQIRYDNAKRAGEDAAFDPTDLDDLRARYGED